jgi:methylenetetrahydrofolate dehydrogenase (NADP+) / methenyltetrahydrofolate cyclohydrolase
MGAKLIEGKVVSADVKSRVAAAVHELEKNGIKPCLATVLVGNDPASTTYVNSKQKTAADLGIATRDHRLDPSFKQGELLELTELLNADPAIHGILVQLPLPRQIDEFSVINSILPSKDVDGLTPSNAGMLQSGRAMLKPCTPSGIIELLDYYRIDPAGMDVVIVNRSNLVGIPLGLMLIEKNATVTICHSRTRKLQEKLLDADLVVTAVGDRQKFTLSSEMVKNGSIIIDVGTARQNGKLVGDVDFDSVKDKASWLTPVPGGVGPMTIAMLMKNTVTAASLASKDRNQ